LTRHRPLPAAAVAPPSDADLDAVASAAGRAWAASTVGELRATARSVNGGWPGTLREARGQVLVALSSRRGPPVSTDRLDALVRTAYASARSEWGAHAEPDLEP
jgi:hypothetical protein